MKAVFAVCIITFPNTWKVVKNTLLRIVIWTLFLVSAWKCGQTQSFNLCLIYLLHVCENRCWQIIKFLPVEELLPTFEILNSHSGPFPFFYFNFVCRRLPHTWQENRFLLQRKLDRISVPLYILTSTDLHLRLIPSRNQTSHWRFSFDVSFARVSPWGFLRWNKTQQL